MSIDISMVEEDPKRFGREDWICGALEFLQMKSVGGVKIPLCQSE
jgi:hypothetical protein